MKRILYKLRTGIFALLLFLTGTAMYAQCPSGMVSYWNLDELTNITYNDFVDSHDANVENAPTNITGISGGAKYFDGTKRVSVASHADFNFTNATSFTIELWARYSDITFGSYNKVMIGRTDPFAASGAMWWLGAAHNTGTLTFYLRDAGGTGFSVTSPKVDDNQWHHIVAVRSASDNTLKLYVDGVLKNSAAAAFTNDFTSNSPIQIGYLSRNSVPEYWFKGGLDEIAIYDRALNIAEVLEHRTKGLMGISYCDGYAPKIKSTPVLTAAVGQLYTYDVNATGMAPIAYSLLEAPAGMAINSSTGLITWTPSSQSVDAKVKVMANNPSYPPADEQSFIINIAEAPTCPDGILNLWKLNETSGPVYADQYGNHAKATVSPSATTGIVNGAQTFGSTTRVDIPYNSSYEWSASANFSIEVWMKTNNTGNTDNLVFMGRLRQDEWFTNWWLGMDGGERPVFYLRDAWGDDTLISGTTSLANGVWHQVVAVRNGTADKNLLYVDGVLVKEAAINYGHGFTTTAADSVPINLGWFDAGSGHEFTGELDEVAIFNKALTVTEITQFYNSRNPAGHCKPGNYAPVITSTANAVSEQGSDYSYTFETSDYDAGDLLTLSAQVKPDWLTFSWTLGQRSAILSGTPANGDVGNANVTLRVTDGNVNKEQSFIIAVANVNDDPEITSTPVTSVDEGAAYAYTVTATDIDEGDVLTFDATAKPAWLAINPTTGVLSGEPAHEDVGDHDITVTVTDGTATVVQSFTITVNSVNVVPVITGQATLSTNRNTGLLLTLADFTVTDPDNDYPADFTLWVLDGDNYGISGNTITPDADYVGNINVGVQVSDGMAMSGIYYTLVEVVVVQSALGTIQSKILSVYPNPASNYVNFRFETMLKSATIEIYNTTGTLIKKQVVDEFIEKIEASSFGAGTYTYRIVSDDKVLNGNFTIME